METKTFNCYSCGAGLRIVTRSELCDCVYCGNTNKINFATAQTVIVEKIKTPARFKSKEMPVWVAVLCVGLIPFVTYRYLLRK